MIALRSNEEGALSTGPKTRAVPTTVRFKPEALKLIQAAATELGEPTSYFIREAAIVRAFLTLDHPTATEVRRSINALFEHEAVQDLANTRR
jgi:uncharacterized protein (DUF1778 family)